MDGDSKQEKRIYSFEVQKDLKHTPFLYETLADNAEEAILHIERFCNCSILDLIAVRPKGVRCGCLVDPDKVERARFLEEVDKQTKLALALWPFMKNEPKGHPALASTRQPIKRDIKCQICKKKGDDVKQVQGERYALCETCARKLLEEIEAPLYVKRRGKRTRKEEV